MALSSIAIETLHDLLEIRIESFLVTNQKEAIQLALLHRCREELLQLQSAKKEVFKGCAPLEAKKPLRPSRRLQREILRYQTASA